MTAFSINFDYRCPGTFVVHDNLFDGLAAGADWDVTFLPFSLGQVHVEPGQLPIWERPGDDSGLLALQVAVTVRDVHPEAFLGVHRAIFDLRHREGRRLDRANIESVLEAAGLPVAEVWQAVDDGTALETVRSEHTDQVKRLDVWGVPTFMIDDQAVFVRLTERSDGDGAIATRRIERVLELMADAPDLNEFKHASLDH